KIMGAIYAVIGLILLPFFLLASLIGSMAGGHDNPLGAIGGLIFGLFAPIFYGVLGFVFGAIVAFLYNLMAKWLGGIEVQEKPDRHRDQEFEMNTDATRADMIRQWEEGWSCVFSAIEALTPEDVMRTVTIRGEPHTVLQALNRQVAHYAYHIGQIVFLAKHFRSGDWKSLSIPRGKSEDYNRKPLSERKTGPSGPRAG